MAQDITSPDGLSLGDPELVAGNIADRAWPRWQAELAAVGGRSPLVQFIDSPRTRIELSTTHPGGLPQFITGKSTLLSSLIRDELALRNARLAAAEITQKGIELRSVRGIDSVHLAIGLASWRNGGEEYLAPVLLRPLAIRRYGRDFELKLKGQPFLNPALARELRQQFQITLDAEGFVALAITNGVFKPQPVIDRLRGLTSHLPWFHVAPRLVVSSFAEVGPAMAADLRRMPPSARRRGGRQRGRTGCARRAGRGARPPGAAGRAPAVDRHACSWTPTPSRSRWSPRSSPARRSWSRRCRERAERRPIVNAIGALVAKDKRVLVVGARRASLDGIAHRLGQVGLGGASVAAASLRRDLILSISRNEKAERPRVADVDGALVRLRKVLLDYRAALNRRDPELRVVGPRRARRACAARAASGCPFDHRATRTRVAGGTRRRPGRRRPRPRPCGRARRVPLRAGRLALVRRLVHLLRGGRHGARDRQARERHRAAAPARTRSRADRANPAAPVRVGRRARGVPAPAPRCT